MSVSAPWFALSSDWSESEMFDDSNHGVRLAWIELLAYVKAYGRAGRVRLRVKKFAEQKRLGAECVEDMLTRAVGAGAVIRHGDEVTINNWKRYQDPKVRHGAEEPSKPDKDLGSIDHHFTKTAVIAENDATNHQSPITTNQAHSPSPNKNTRSRTLPSAPDDLFERFWESFPSGRKTRKAAARRKWDVAIRTVAPETIIAAAVEYAASPLGQGKYVSGPEPWLNGARWDDDRASWQRKDETNGNNRTHTPGPGQLFDGVRPLGPV